ncbi:MAG: hypothetical protein ABIP61_10420 [Burkholderiaceae bacterium]
MRGFELDLEHCQNFAGKPKLIAALLEPPDIDKIFTHQGLQARAAPRSVARHGPAANPKGRRIAAEPSTLNAPQAMPRAASRLRSTCVKASAGERTGV